MYCPNCGKQIETGVAFCPNCGANLKQQQPQVQPTPTQQPIYQQPVQQTTNKKPASKKGRIVGIVMLVLGLMSFLGSCMNGTFASFAYGVDLSDVFMIIMLIGLIAGGIYLIIKNKNK